MPEQPIIIKKVKKGGHGHHGGAWKVAYADFVTAMMAFFLLLWLLNAVTDEQLEGISNYFNPISTAASTNGSNGLMGGQTVTATQNYQDPIEVPPEDIQPPTDEVDTNAPEIGESNVKPAKLSKENLDKLLKEREERQFEAAEQELRTAIEAAPELKGLTKSLMIDRSPEGLRIQIVDQEGLPMFPRGSTEMYEHTRKLLAMIAKIIQRMPQKIAISGHTDATRYVSDSGYSNWELSAGRANAARRELIALGVPEQRIARMVAKAATEPLLADDPEAPANRRLSVVLLRGSAEPEKMTGIDAHVEEGAVSHAEEGAVSNVEQR